MPLRKIHILFVACVAILFVGIAIFIFFHFFSRTPIVSTSVCTLESPTLVTKAEASGKTNEQIVRLLSERWLNRFVSKNSCSALWLDRYTIEKIVVDDKATFDQYTISYSVKPYHSSSGEWQAGNGENSSDGWIRHKFAFIKVKVDASGGYGIQSAATGP